MIKSNFNYVNAENGEVMIKKGDMVHVSIISYFAHCEWEIDGVNVYVKVLY